MTADDDQIPILPAGLVRVVEAILIITREGKTTQAEVARKIGVNRRYLERYIQFLSRAGILATRTGPSGGLRLAKPTKEISVGDLARVCSEVSYSSSVADSQKSPITALQFMRHRMIAEMDAVTIADLLTDLNIRGGQPRRLVG